MNTYETIRQKYRPKNITMLLVAESPPPASSVESSRHFYRSDTLHINDRLFANTMKALYPEAATKTETQLQQNKEEWLQKFRNDGWYMIEALEESLPHEITKKERQARIRQALPRLMERINKLASKQTKIILIKSNVFEVAAEPLRKAGFTILNKELLDYPGQYNQRTYREKLAKLANNL